MIRHGLVPSILIGLLGLVTVPRAAVADDAVNQVNAPFARIADASRSDLVILPLLAKMQPPPAFIDSVDTARLLPAGSSHWSEAEGWAKAEPQAALITAISTVTGETDYRKAMVFALQYGIEAVAGKTDLISNGLYVDLGEDGTLAGAKFLYLNAVDRLEMLVHIEATRLAAEGKDEDAIRLMMRWCLFARQLCDRQFAREKITGLRMICRGLERARDIAFQDFHAADHHIKADTIISALQKSIAARESLLGLDRIAFPAGDRAAASQMLSRVMVRGGGPDPETFATELARVAATDRPLRLFSEAAKWESLRAAHADEYTSNKYLQQVFDDWERRWRFYEFDPVLKTESDYDREVKKGGKAKALEACLEGVADIFEERLRTRTEAAGTRTSLAIYAYYLRETGKYPPMLISLQPIYVNKVDADPYSPAKNAILYMVPMRDTPPNERGEPQPYTIRIYPPSTSQNFQVSLRNDNFCVYSAGSDEDDDRLEYATQGDRTAKDGDYLLWPPVLSLVRQRLVETGQLR